MGGPGSLRNGTEASAAGTQSAGKEGSWSTGRARQQGCLAVPAAQAPPLPRDLGPSSPARLAISQAQTSTPQSSSNGAATAEHGHPHPGTEGQSPGSLTTHPFPRHKILPVPPPAQPTALSPPCTEPSTCLSWAKSQPRRWHPASDPDSCQSVLKPSPGVACSLSHARACTHTHRAPIKHLSWSLI